LPRQNEHRIEQGLTSPPTQYRSSWRQFFRSKDPTNSIKVLQENSWPATLEEALIPPGASHRVRSKLTSKNLITVRRSRTRGEELYEWGCSDYTRQRCDSADADKYAHNESLASAQHHHSDHSSISSSSELGTLTGKATTVTDYTSHETMTEMADSDFHDYINFEYYLQSIGKYRNQVSNYC